MFEMAKDFISTTLPSPTVREFDPHAIDDHQQDHAVMGYQLLGGYFSPVSDAYNKPGLALAEHRVRMLQLALGSHNEQ